MERRMKTPLLQFVQKWMQMVGLNLVDVISCILMHLEASWRWEIPSLVQIHSLQPDLQGLHKQTDIALGLKSTLKA